MTNRENYYSIAKRNGYEYMPTHISMCPSLAEKFKEYCEEKDFHYEEPIVCVGRPLEYAADKETYLKYYDRTFEEGTYFDYWGCAHEKGSEAAYHMTKLYYPMANFDDIEQILEYPFPIYSKEISDRNLTIIEQAKRNDKIVRGELYSVSWERAWQLRSMENLMTDMMLEEPIAEVLLDKVTEISIAVAEDFARSGVDYIYMGDDIGMQRSIMMSEELYCTWLLPRLKKVIAAAKAINPNILIFYHSCGYIKPMIPYLIDAGVDVLNPIQPESMDFSEIHAEFGDKISFHGTIGTQTTMPFGTTDDVRREVFKNLEIAGDKGGLFVAPTHLLEPEVPVENVIAYIKACHDFK